MEPTNRQKAQELLEYAEFLAEETNPGTRSMALAMVAVGRMLIELTEVLKPTQAKARGNRVGEEEK